MGTVIKRENAATASTFSFTDVEREAAAIIAQARTKAAALVNSAEQRVQQIVDTHKHEGYQSGVAEGRRAGFEQARKEGRAAALTAAQGELDKLTQALREGVQAYEARKRSLIADAEAGLIELALAIAQRVCKLTVEASSDAARANARALLELVQHDHDIELHLHPADHECLREVAHDVVGDIAERDHVHLKANESVQRGGCVLRSRDGHIDSAIERQLQRVARALCGHDLERDDG
jgi:flagellar assembly protein FliH